MYDVICDDFVKSFEGNVEAFHKLFKVNNLNSGLLEELVHNSFVEIGKCSDWERFDHAKGKDLMVDGIDISIKAGELSQAGKLKISSYRTTSLKTIEEKNNFFAEKHEDFTLSFSFNKKTEQYNMFMFDVREQIPFQDLAWTETNSGWGVNGDGFSARILKPCSDQLWYTIDTNKDSVKHVCTINKA